MSSMQSTFKAVFSALWVGVEINPDTQLFWEQLLEAEGLGVIGPQGEVRTRDMVATEEF